MADKLTDPAPAGMDLSGSEPPRTQAMTATLEREPTADELAHLADQQAYARSRYNEDDAGLIRESKVIEWALRRAILSLAQAKASEGRARIAEHEDCLNCQCRPEEMCAGTKIVPTSERAEAWLEPPVLVEEDRPNGPAPFAVRTPAPTPSVQEQPVAWREQLAQIVMTTQECGMGDRDAAGNFRNMFCDDERLTRYDGKRDKCECRATVEAIAALATPSKTAGEREIPKARPLEWLETFTDRGDGSKDQTGWEADSGFGSWYGVDLYFASDSYAWQVKFDCDVIGDSDDPDAAKAIAQKHLQDRIDAALSPTGAKP